MVDSEGIRIYTMRNNPPVQFFMHNRPLPRLTDVTFLFKRDAKDSRGRYDDATALKERKHIMLAIEKFFSDKSLVYAETAPQRMLLSGIVYGREPLKDGTIIKDGEGILTSPVVRIERTAQEHLGVELFAATTADKKTYFFERNTLTEWVERMLTAVRSRDGLNLGHGFYRAPREDPAEEEMFL